MKAQYNEGQLQAAAYFLSTFNEFAGSFDEIHDSMIDCIERYASDEETEFVSTGGYYLLFARNEEPGVVVVDILVDPTIMFCHDEEDYKLVHHEL